MNVALWLAAREMASRRKRVVLAAAVVAAIAAASTAVELVGRGREEAVAARIDAIAPALTVVPRGVSSGALARLELGDALLRDSLPERVKATLGSDLRSLEARLVRPADVSGVKTRVIGRDTAEIAGSTGGVTLGSELARRLEFPRVVAVNGRELRVDAVEPSTGSAEDLAVLLPLAHARNVSATAGVNEMRLYLRAGVAAADAEATLARAGIDAAVIRNDRGAVADLDVIASLALHRRAAYVAMALVAALCLAIAAHLDASERRAELATLAAVGATRWTILGAVVLRSAMVAATGAAAGILGGAAAAWGQHGASIAALLRAWPVGLTTIAVALVVGTGAAMPIALAASVRNPVPDLQEQ